MSTRLEEALDKMNKNVDKATESVRKAYEATFGTTTPRTRIPYSPHLPHNVDCTECKRAITGRLFTCLECDSYHLCHGCERSGRHIKHPMLRLGHPDTPREIRKVEKTYVEVKEVEKLVETKFEHVAERIAAVEETIANHQVISKDKTLPAPTVFRSERAKRHRDEGRASRKPKRIPYPLPTSWSETLHETQKKAKLDARYAEKKKSVVIERLPEAANHDAVVQAVLDHSDFKHKTKFRTAQRLGKQSDDRNRIVKVQFETDEAALDFTRLFRTATTHLTEDIVDYKPYVRRDLTPVELEFRSDLRALARWINENTADKVILIDLDMFYKV